ncbi:hypothetical protein Taro_021039 [Colocasia esculenta]|uniref:Protein root UVB sensitive 3 n=1 Tax=Colocasia esculenta TaxID=4460 RepID=A0A843V0B2_COLES|nr:hypothetical protein [Colocasia esculenta]
MTTSHGNSESTGAATAVDMEKGGEEGRGSPLPDAAGAAASFTIEEWRGSSAAKLTRTAVLTADSSSLSLNRSGSQWSELRRKVAEAFGFPGSVTRDYLPFQIWDSLQALLSAIGVGEKSATVIGATFQWFLRDLTGMLGGILFTFYQGSNLDSNAKMWRLVADFMNDLGMLMDLVSPLFPSALIAIVCLGSLSRSFTGVASGATRAALTQHFSLQNNAADISAKEGSQETVATMIGMALGMLLAHITRGQPLAIWFSFLSLTMFHMFANYKAVRSLSLTTLNDERSSLLLQHFMKTGQAGVWHMCGSLTQHVTWFLDFALSAEYSRISCYTHKLHALFDNYLIWLCCCIFAVSGKFCVDLLTLFSPLLALLLKALSPQQASAMEHVFPSWIYLWSSSRTEHLHKYIHLGVKVSSLKHADVTELLRLSGSLYKRERYLLLERKGVVHVIMHRESSPEDILQAFIHALVIAILMDTTKSFHTESRIWMDEHYPHFITKLKSMGWTTDRLLSHSIIWRAQWVHGAEDGKLN